MSIVNNRVSSASVFDCSVAAVTDALEKVRLARQERHQQASAEQLMKIQGTIASATLRPHEPMPWLGNQSD